MSDPNLQSSQYVPHHQDGSGLHVLSEAATAILANKRHSTPVLIRRPTSETPFSGSLSTSDMSSDPSINLKRNSTPPSLVVDDGSSDQAMSDLSSSSSSHRVADQAWSGLSSHRVVEQAWSGLSSERNVDQPFNGFSVAQLMLKRERSVSSGSLTKRERSVSSGSLTYRGSPYDHRNDVKRSSDLASAVFESNHFGHSHESDEDETDHEQPLDMSIKNKSTSECLVAGRPFLPSLNPQQLRPSVIQCVPRNSLETPSSSFSFLNHGNQPSSNPSHSSFSFLNYADHSRTRCSKKTEHSISERASKLRILSGPQDGDGDASDDDNHDDDASLGIDEHFRRSLGNKYPLILNKQQPTEKTDTCQVPEVDDHFAKALGPTWYKLNKNGDKEAAETSNKAQGVAS